nr:hypothetical protein TQ38_27270 [Novosphingobium sp. P6W]
MQTELAGIAIVWRTRCGEHLIGRNRASDAAGFERGRFASDRRALKSPRRQNGALDFGLKFGVVRDLKRVKKTGKCLRHGHAPFILSPLSFRAEITFRDGQFWYGGKPRQDAVCGANAPSANFLRRLLNVQISPPSSLRA